jgi:hypothetical protein
MPFSPKTACRVGLAALCLKGGVQKVSLEGVEISAVSSRAELSDEVCDQGHGPFLDRVGHDHVDLVWFQVQDAAAAFRHDSMVAQACDISGT